MKGTRLLQLPFYILPSFLASLQLLPASCAALPDSGGGAGAVPGACAVAGCAAAEEQSLFQMPRLRPHRGGQHQGKEPMLAGDTGTRGFLVERLFHTEAIVCPWQPPGEAPDTDCQRRLERIDAIRDAISVCEEPLRRNDKTLGHRGAPLVAPEETVASWQIGAESGAGYLECDASITNDLDLICRHSNCDLDTTTDLIANHPDLNEKCTVPFNPGSGIKATCCTFDFTMEELSRLCATMDSVYNASANSYSAYVVGPPGFRTGAVAKEKCHPLVSYRDYLRLLHRSGFNAIPELKDTWEQRTENFLKGKGKDIYWLADLFADMLQDQGFHPWPKPGCGHNKGTLRGVMQTFDFRIAEHWKTTRGDKATVEYMWQVPPPPGANCSNGTGNGYYGGPDGPGGDCGGEALLRHLDSLGVDMFSPPIQTLITNGTGRTIVPSETARTLMEMKVKSIGSWSLERQGCPQKPGGTISPAIPDQSLAPCWGPDAWYYSTVDGSAAWQYADVLLVLDTLFKDIGLKGLFSDFPATVSAYVNCALGA